MRGRSTLSVKTRSVKIRVKKRFVDAFPEHKHEFFHEGKFNLRGGPARERAPEPSLTRRLCGDCK